MGAYSESAELYDLLYAGVKDYAAEAELLAALIRERRPDARHVLDVACGTGGHARHLTDRGFEVDGVDIEPALVRIASGKCPEGTFRVTDICSFDLPERYDAVLCLFSAIGYAKDESRLRHAVAHMAAHLRSGGVLIVDPWFEPGTLTHGFHSALVGESDDVTACRISRTLIDGSVSRLECEYLIATSEGIERRSELHELGLFTQTQMESAFDSAGLAVERIEEVLRTRGIYIGVAPSTGAGLSAAPRGRG